MLKTLLYVHFSSRTTLLPKKSTQIGQNVHLEWKNMHFVRDLIVWSNWPKCSFRVEKHAFCLGPYHWPKCPFREEKHAFRAEPIWRPAPNATYSSVSCVFPKKLPPHPFRACILTFSWGEFLGFLLPFF